jgi:hypothetical protein
MTWWKTILWAIAVVLAFHLIAGDMGCFGERKEPAPPPIVPTVRDTVFVKESSVDTVVVGADVPCRNFSINRASYTCR